MAIDLKTLEKLLSLVKKHKLAELEVEDGKSKFKIRTASKSSPIQVLENTVGSVASVPMAKLNTSPLLSNSEVPQKIQDGFTQVLSPFVGTFYRAPSPEAEPYVIEGKRIKKGEVLCIVEAMKLMNEIESEFNGKIVNVLAENGQPVEYGEPLFLIDPT